MPKLTSGFYMHVEANILYLLILRTEAFNINCAMQFFVVISNPTYYAIVHLSIIDSEMFVAHARSFL
jgi:hypothetical protein